MYEGVSLGAPHPGSVFPLATPNSLFYSKEVESRGPSSEWSVNTVGVDVNIIVQRGASEPTAVLTALQPPLETSLSHVREALRTDTPEQVSGASSSPAPAAWSRPQPVSRYSQRGSARQPLQEPTGGPSALELHGDL